MGLRGISRSPWLDFFETYGCNEEHPRALRDVYRMRGVLGWSKAEHVHGKGGRISWVEIGRSVVTVVPHVCMEHKKRSVRIDDDADGG